MKMFAGLMGVEGRSSSLPHRCEVPEGGRASGTAGGAGRKRLHRRPGYMREQSRPHGAAHGQEEEEEEEDEEDGRSACIRNGKSGRHCDLSEAAPRPSQSRAVRVSLMNLQQPDRLTCSSCRIQSFLGSVTRPLPTVHCGPVGGESLSEPGSRGSPTQQAPLEGSFNSSFSFIRQSLSDAATEPRNASAGAPHRADTLPAQHSKQATAFQPPAAPSAAIQPEKEAVSGTFWRESLWPHLPDCDSRPLDLEVTSSLSVDSDTASASSVTSGYESATPASEQGWDNLVKKYEGVLQDCLQNNRTHTTIESMMLKLQRLQQKAISDDDYDAAERFGKKLEELCRERGALTLGLPSRQPGVALFLERLRLVVHGALQRAQCSQRREAAEPSAPERCDSLQGPMQRKVRLIQEKRLVQEEITELQRRLAELEERGRCLEQQIQQEEQQVEAEELESSVLRSCTVAQLRDMSRTLQDLVTSENRSQICVAPPASMLRLQEQEQALNLSIKEATAKVVMSQRLGSSLRRKVSETETQLLTLHEAKLAAISGNDFGSAKELKAEMKAVYLERDRLEALAKRLHSLSSGSGQELARMKEQRQQLRQELEEREAQHESKLKENTSKYMELLEDRMHSSCPGLERIWEADLEACHLFLRGLQLRTSSCSGTDVEDPPAASDPPTQPGTKEEEDCAMLTALGGRWCPEADLQNSEFTKKLEEFLFCMEEIHPEDGCSEAEATDLTARCELISDRLMNLEDELQTAILSRDQALAQSLEKEVQEVKSTLQTMLAQLKVESEEEEDEEEEEEELNDLMKNGTEEEEEEEEEEDQYFSDSWDI